MANPTNKAIRQSKARGVHDVLNIGNLTFNKASGGQKNMPVGPHLKPLNDDVSVPSFTTDATTVRAVRPGSVLAVYNNAGAVGSITLGETNAIASLAPGATDVGGHVGVACKPNDWTYISVYDQPFVVASAATLLVYLISDF